MWKGAPAFEVRDCHPHLAEAVNDALSRWDIAVATPPDRDRELLELWYLFPERPGPARVFVKQAAGQQLTLRQGEIPEGYALTVLPWSIVSRTHIDFPERAEAVADLNITECDVSVVLAASGMPSRVSVSRCDEVFREDLAEALRAWRFDMPLIDGAASQSALDLTVRFRRSTGPDDPSRVEIDLPKPPDLGPDAAIDKSKILGEVIEIPIPPLPDREPLFVVDTPNYASVSVYEMIWPQLPPSDRDRSCEVQWVVNSKRRVFAWPNGCDDDISALVSDAAARWVLAPGEIAAGERYARFRGTLVFPSSGTPALQILASDLQTKRPPPEVHPYQPAKAMHTAQPKLPKDLVVGDDAVCELDVQVSPRGKPAAIAPSSCPSGLVDPAERAVSRWRWLPASIDGRPISSRVLVRIRFSS